MQHRKDIVFSKPSIFKPGIAEYAAAHSSQPPAIAQDIYAQTFKRCPQWADIAAKPIQVTLLGMLASVLQVTRILEIGTFSGHSTVSLAQRLPPGGEIVTLDNFAADKTAQEIANSAFARSPDKDKINLLVGDALDSLETISGPFELIFVDADKPNYQNYFNIILERDLLHRDGLLIFDNTLWGGHILNTSHSETTFETHANGQQWLDGMLLEWGRLVADFNRYVLDDARVETVLLTVHDGMTFLRRTHSTLSHSSTAGN